MCTGCNLSSCEHHGAALNPPLLTSTCWCGGFFYLNFVCELLPLTNVVWYDLKVGGRTQCCIRKWKRARSAKWVSAALTFDLLVVLADDLMIYLFLMSTLRCFPWFINISINVWISVSVELEGGFTLSWSMILVTWWFWRLSDTRRKYSLKCH